jgi:hypothetical protein
LSRAALGKNLSGNFESAKRAFTRALYRALNKAFAEGHGGTRQRKAATTVPAPWTPSLPRAISVGPQQRIVLFFEKSLPRASPRALGKEILIFFSKNLCRGPLAMALGKEIFAEFFQKIFAEGNGKGPRQRTLLC